MYFKKPQRHKMKARKILMIVLFIALMIGSRSVVLGQEACAPEPPDGGSVTGSGPAGDKPDDNYSFSSGTVREFNLFPNAVVLTEGYWQQALKLYGGLKAVPEFTANALLQSTPFLIVPTGGFFSFENDATFKIILQEYVRLGGTIIVFGQQFGSQIDKSCSRTR